MKVIKEHRAFEGTVKFMEHDSTSTNTPMHFSVFEPYNAPQGVLLWLSGLTCNEENFITKANALPYASKHNLIIVCPDTSPRNLSLPNEHDSWDFGSGASFYVNATTTGYRDHYQMQDYIAVELYAYLQQQYQVPIGLFGHSMGGHGALTIGLTYPDKFTAISAFSPIVAPLQCPWGQKAFKGFLSNQSTWKQYDTCELLYQNHKHSNPLLVHQGTKDEFLESQLKTSLLKTACDKMDQPLQLHYCEGYDHSYYFISSFVKDHIAFHLKYL